MNPVRAAVRILDWKTLVVAGGLFLLVFIGYAVYSGAQARHEANQRATQSAKAATRRIDKLQAKIDALQRQLLAQVAQDKRQQGASDAKLAAVAEQVRQLGGTPVATADPTTPTTPTAPGPTPHATHGPSPRPTRTTTPAPRPTPSPTCTRLQVGPVCI